MEYRTKVCHMSSAHSSSDTRIFYKECTSLAKAGYDVYLVIRGSSREENGVHVYGVGNPRKSRFYRMFFFSRKIYQRALKVDAAVYHLHDPELLRYAKKLKKRGKIVIFDSHENVPGQILDKEWIPAPFRKIVSKLYEWYQSLQIGKIDGVIAVSPNYVAALQNSQKRTVMVSNFPILNHSEKNEHIVGRQSRKIVFPGPINFLHNHHKVIKALEQVPGAMYELCGHAEDTQYFNELQQLPAWNRVHYHGVIPHKEVATLIQESAVGVVLTSPNHNAEGMTGTLGNTKIFEYMAEGLPVVFTGFLLWREIAEKYPFGIAVDPTNTDEIAAAINFILNHPEEARQMGENGRRAVKEKFNWGVEEKKLLALYESILQDD